MMFGPFLLCFVTIVGCFVTISGANELPPYPSLAECTKYVDQYAGKSVPEMISGRILSCVQDGATESCCSVVTPLLSRLSPIYGCFCNRGFGAYVAGRFGNLNPRLANVAAGYVESLVAECGVDVREVCPRRGDIREDQDAARERLDEALERQERRERFEDAVNRQRLVDQAAAQVVTQPLSDGLVEPAENR